MIFFKKEAPAPVKKPKSLQEIVRDRILTAEGWRRRMASKNKKPK